jgi:sterol desaturase/sphingolipid hydroxylase (fatty acid hydroxylase superfamily)
MTIEKLLILRALCVWGGIIVFCLFECRYAYRSSSVSKIKRWVTNLSLTAINGVVLNLVFGLAILATVAYVTHNRMGLFYLMDLSTGARFLLTIIVLDFFLYVWHLLNHVMPTLWRFHQVHHSDMNMDVSTASRFHIGELAISALIRIALIYTLGVKFEELVVFEIVLVLSAQFQHSVLSIPQWFERMWWVVFVPPSMHRIHHSVIIKERNSNYGTIFSLWDRVFGTLLTNVDQERIRIGVGSYHDADKLMLPQLCIMPFKQMAK